MLALTTLRRVNAECQIACVFIMCAVQMKGAMHRRCEFEFEGDVEEAGRRDEKGNKEILRCGKRRKYPWIYLLGYVVIGVSYFGLAAAHARQAVDGTAPAAFVVMFSVILCLDSLCIAAQTFRPDCIWIGVKRIRR